MPRQTPATLPTGRPDEGGAWAKRDAPTGPSVESGERVGAVLRAAGESGLLGEKSARVGGRISPALLEQARQRTGIASDSDLIEFALANVALADEFAATYRRLRGSVEPELKLGF